MRHAAMALCVAAVLTASPFAHVAVADEAPCLDCHEPAEDWAGMSGEEIFAAARSTEIKRHADNQELSDDQLRAFIAELTKK